MTMHIKNEGENLTHPERNLFQCPFVHPAMNPMIQISRSAYYTHPIYGMVYIQTWRLLTSKTQMNVTIYSLLISNMK